MRTTTRSRPSIALVLLALVLASMALLAPAATAASPPRLQGQVTDAAGVFGSDVGQVKSALDDLLRDHDIQLFVLFVGTTDPLTSTQFADQTAAANSLGANDALLLVAVDDHTDAIWISDTLAGALTDRELDAIIADDLEPGLRDGDFPGAVIATAEALGVAAAPAPIPTERPTNPPDQGGSSGAGSPDPGPIVGVLLLVVGLIFVGAWVRLRLAARHEAEERDRATGRLARDANAGLLAIDERIRTADQEAGFVEAEFGEAEAAPFHAAIEEARGELKAAFGVRQKLDDDEPEDPPTREQMLKEIVERCGRAAAALDRQAARIEELRNLERNAATILAALPAQVEAQEQRLPAAEASLAALSGYADSASSSVKGNVAEARKGLAGARAAIDSGSAALARNNARAAAHGIVTAQEGVTGAAALLDAVDKQAVAARDAETRLSDELRQAEADLAAARSAAPAPAAGAAAPHAADLAAAEATLRSASAAAATTPLDPLAAYKLAASARRGAGDVLVAIRQEAAQQQQFLAALDSSIASARADVERASDFIATRRGGVGRRARTRLAEAERMLETATSLRDGDPKGAMDAARRAERMAEEAYSLAAQDFAGWNSGGPSPAGGGSDIAGAILGGIIGGILAGGGRRGGGWGGSPWGSSGPFGGGGGWGGGGHSRGGGFGGFGGGGGGGGGGHSRGGRW